MHFDLSKPPYETWVTPPWCAPLPRWLTCSHFLRFEESPTLIRCRDCGAWKRTVPNTPKKNPNGSTTIIVALWQSPETKP